MNYSVPTLLEDGVDLELWGGGGGRGEQEGVFVLLAQDPPLSGPYILLSLI